MAGPDHDARKDSKTPWGSQQFQALLSKLGIKPTGTAMSLVMDIDFASRDKKADKMRDRCRALALLRVTGSHTGTPGPDHIGTVEKLTIAVMREYDKIDAVFQEKLEEAARKKEMEEAARQKETAKAQSEEDDDLFKSVDGSIASSQESDTSKRFAAMVEKARLRMTKSIEMGRPEEAKSFAQKFAASSIKSGLWQKSENDLIVPLFKSASTHAKTSAKGSDMTSVTDHVDDGTVIPMAPARNGKELPLVVLQSPNFKKDIVNLTKAFKAEDGPAVYDAIDWLTEEAHFQLDSKYLKYKISQQDIMDFFFTAAQQKEMKAWDDAPPSEFSADFKTIVSASVSTDDSLTGSFTDYQKLGPADVKKVDMKSVASVYGLDEDDTEELQRLTLDAVKKGADNPGVQKSAKDLLAAAKKKKKKPKAKNARVFAYGLLDAVFKAVNKKKLTKPLKESDISE